MEKIDELKRLLEILPRLEETAKNTELIYLRQSNSQYGHQENGYVYKVTPTTYNNYFLSKKEYEIADKRRWYLIVDLGLTANVKGIPEFEENAFDRHEPRYIRDLEFGDLPIDYV